MNESLCQGLHCSRKERCTRFLRIEEETKKITIGLPWMATQYCRPGYYEVEEDYKFFIDVALVA